MKENAMYEIAGGSIVGRDHLFRGSLLIGKNNQDSFGWTILNDGRTVLAAVCDGCGSRPHSDVGASLGNRILLSVLTQKLQDKNLPDSLPGQFWESVRQDILAELRVLGRVMAAGGSFTETVADYFLFTVVAAVLTPTRLYTLSCGDGVLIVNGEVQNLGPFPDNTPPYLAYSLIESSFSATPELLRFRVGERDITEVQSVLIGSDGVAELITSAERSIPCNGELIGPISQFWDDGRYFKNRDLIRRRLALINSVEAKADKSGAITMQQGLLADDTTLVVVRKKPQPSN